MVFVELYASMSLRPCGFCDISQSVHPSQCGKICASASFFALEPPSRRLALRFGLRPEMDKVVLKALRNDVARALALGCGASGDRARIDQGFPCAPHQWSPQAS